MRFNRQLFILVPLLLGGCALVPPQSQVTWVEFDEPQQAWPTSATGLARWVDGFPAYGFEQFPPHPYEVLGYLHATAVASPESPAPIELQALVTQARAHGGEALLLAKKTPPSPRPHLAKEDFLVVKFKNRSLADAVERIDLYLALTAESTGDHFPASVSSSALGASAEGIAATRAALQKARQALLARPELQAPAHGTPTNALPISR